MKRITCLLAVLMGLALTGSRVLADDEEKPDWKGTITVAKGTDETALPAMAKIGFPDALQAALKKAPGKVLKAELEGEDGYLIYSVEIVGADKVITEVSLDAGTGAVLLVEKEDPAKEAAEAKKECKKGCKKGEGKGEGKEKGEDKDKD